MVGQERQEVFAHRCLLACRCNFFQRLLGPGVPSPVVLSTVPAEAFLAVLEFLYTNSVKLHRYSVSLPSRGLGGREAEDDRGVGETPFCPLNHSHSPTLTPCRCWRCSQQLWSTGWRNSERWVSQASQLVSLAFQFIVSFTRSDLVTQSMTALCVHKIRTCSVCAK